MLFLQTEKVQQFWSFKSWWAGRIGTFSGWRTEAERAESAGLGRLPSAAVTDGRKSEESEADGSRGAHDYVSRKMTHNSLLQVGGGGYRLWGGVGPETGTRATFVPDRIGVRGER